MEAALKRSCHSGRHPRPRNIPIIILSIVDQKRVGFALGAADYLIKPVRKPELLETIRKHVPAPADDDSTILLVDDDPKALELLEETLRSRRIRDPERAQWPACTRGALEQSCRRGPARLAHARYGRFPGHPSRATERLL